MGRDDCVGTAAAEGLIVECGEASRNSLRWELDKARPRTARGASSLSGNATRVTAFVAEKFGLVH